MGNHHEEEGDKEKSDEESPPDTSSLVGLRLMVSKGLLVDQSWPDERVTLDSMGRVTVLSLGGKRIHRGFPCLGAFSHFSALKSLNLGGTDIPLKDLEVILGLVADSIECIFLGGNGGFGDVGAGMIGNWLQVKSPKNLFKVDLRYNEITEKGMMSLCEGIRDEITAITHLYMEGNQIGDQGCVYLAELLNDDCCKLTQAFLGANEIKAAGALALASALKANMTLEKLYLEGNNIGMEGASAFSQALEDLKGDSTLKNLYVDNNNIGKAGSKRLAAALHSATVISSGLTEEDTDQ